MPETPSRNMEVSPLTLDNEYMPSDNRNANSTVGRTRQENSLGELTKKFIGLIQKSPYHCINLNDAVKELGVQKR